MAILGVLAGLAVIIAAGDGGPRDSYAPESKAAIRVVSNTHSVHFPRNVVFKLEAEADEPITEVRLFYRLARTEVQVYGYPDFTPSKKISTDYIVKTSGANYIPSGVDIEYFYEIVDAKGNTLETERRTLGYRDPSFTWQELQDGAVVVMWHDRSYERVSETVAELNQRFARVQEVFDLEQLPPIRAVILNSRREAERSFPPISGAARSGHLYGGFAYNDYDLFVLSGLNVDGMLHEAVHLMLHEAVSSPRARVPAWLHEGLAQWFESRTGQRQRTAERAARTGQLMRLSHMNSQPGKPSAVRIFYAQAWSVVDYIIDTHGEERVAALLRALDSGQRIDEALTSAYGFGLEQLEAAWKADLTGETTLAPRPDPGTIATSTIITGAAAVALAVTIMRWIMKWLSGRTVAK